MEKSPQKGGTVTSDKKEHVSETVYQAVKNMVFLNRFKPGRSLNVERLARELGVSRTPTWEAIRRLDQDGIVRKVPNRGVYMREDPLERVLHRSWGFSAAHPSLCAPPGRKGADQGRVL